MTGEILSVRINGKSSHAQADRDNPAGESVFGQTQNLVTRGAASPCLEMETKNLIEFRRDFLPGQEEKTADKKWKTFDLKRDLDLMKSSWEIDAYSF